MFYTYQFLGIDLIWWMVCLIGIVLFFSFFNAGIKKRAKRTPLDILQRKFSNGEIDTNEYEKRKRLLEKDMDTELRSYFLSASYK